MPIEERVGSVLDAIDTVQVLVNTVNTKGVMGKGLAAEFKKRFGNAMFEHYKSLCEHGYVKPGRPYLTKALLKDRPDKEVYILHFPTKDHWKHRSRIAWIEEGLAYFRDHYHDMPIITKFPPPHEKPIGTMTQTSLFDNSGHASDEPPRIGDDGTEHDGPKSREQENRHQSVPCHDGDKDIDSLAEGRLRIESIAFPQLGCRNGGLSWTEVRQLMYRYLGDLNDIDVYIYLYDRPDADPPRRTRKSNPSKSGRSRTPNR